MRVLHDIGDSLLDFVEENKYGSLLFRLGRIALLGMVLLVVGRIAAGQFLSFQWDDVLFMAIAVLVFMLIAWRWEIGLIAIVVTTASIIHYRAIPTLSLYHFVPEIRWLEDFRLLLGQGILLYLLFLFAISRQSATFIQRVSTPLSAAVMLFMLAALIAGVAGVVFNEVPFHYMVERARPYSYYLMFFAALLCIRDRTAMKITAISLLAIAVFVSLAMALQFFSGNSIRLFIGDSIRVESLVGQYATRVLPPGQSLVWLLIPPLVAVTPQLKGAAKTWGVLALWILSVGLLLTLTRAMWMGTLVGVLAMLIFSGRVERTGMVRVFIVFAALVMFLLLLLGTISTSTEDIMGAYIQRFTSVFTSEAYVESSTVGARMDEVRAAWEQIVKHPWMGLGIGAIYNYELLWEQSTFSFEWKGITYIHNVYVLILTKMGLLGLVTFAAMVVTYFVRAWKIYRMVPTGVDSAIVLGGMGATLSCVVGSNLQPSLASPGPVSVLALMWGVTEFLRWQSSQDANPQNSRRDIPQ